MTKATVPMRYSISTDLDVECFYEGETFQGTYTMKGPGDELICLGPAKMSVVILGMTRLASYAHELLRMDPDKLHRVLTGELTANNEITDSLQATQHDLVNEAQEIMRDGADNEDH